VEKANTLAYCITATITAVKSFIVEAPGAIPIKLLTAVIYHHSTVIPSFCVIKPYYLGNYCGMAVNYCGILTLEKVGLELLWYCTPALFLTLAPGTRSLP
jgi:hypothetical protein